MASQTVSSNNWLNVFRSGDTGVAWAGISTGLQSSDANRVTHTPWVDIQSSPPFGPYDRSIAYKSPTLRVYFPAFGLPPGDSITSMMLAIWLYRPTNPVDGGSTRLVDAGGTLVGYTFTPTIIQIMVPISVFPSIATLNTGGVYYVDLNCEATGGPIVVPHIDGVPDCGFDRVTLTVTTITPGTGTYPYVPRKTSIIGAKGIRV